MKRFITHPEIENYAECFSSTEDQLLHRIYRETNVRRLNPRMLSGHLQGLLLRQISFMIKPERILEIGTFTGYSAICLAQGLVDDGLLITIDNDPEMEDVANGYFELSGKRDKIRMMIGAADEIIPELNETFDLVFIDADKENYLRYYHLVFDKVRINGFILADNVLWDGKVIDNSDHDSETNGIMEFNNFIKTDNRIEKVMLPMRDGIFLIRKITG